MLCTMRFSIRPSNPQKQTREENTKEKKRKNSSRKGIAGMAKPNRKGTTQERADEITTR
jgi:hypothetical protein